MSIKDLVTNIKRNGLLASMPQLEELYQVAIANEQKLAESEARCAALAAENAGLKAAIPPLKIINDVTDSWDDVSLAEDVGFNYAVSAILKSLPETPSTDAFLAEVRAQHLQSYADCIAARMKDKSLSMRQKELLNFAWAEVKSYAAELHNAQLRKGVQS